MNGVRAILTALCVGASVRPCVLLSQSLTMVRFGVASDAALDSVRRLGIDVVEIRPRPGGSVEILAVVSQRDRGLLASRGLSPVDIPRPAGAAPALRAPVVYRDFDDPARGIAAWLRAFDASHANVVVDSIGASGQGRPILAAKIGVAGAAAARPNILYMATYHAREWAATEMARRLIEYLADSLPLTPTGPALLATRDIWVIPVVNPDGYQYTFSTERFWRKNRRLNSAGVFGVDLNRNHAAFWGFDDAGSSPDPNSEVYRGPAAVSEPEIQAIEAFHRSFPPVASISYHTYTGAVLYPWSHVYGIRSGDDALFRALAGSDIAPAIHDNLPMSANDYYHPGPGWHLYTTNGEYTMYAYRSFRTMAYTVELTSGCCVGGGQFYGFDFPDDELMLQTMARDNMPFALSLVNAAPDIVAGPAFPAPGGAVTQFESVWPEVQVLLDVTSNSGNTPVDIATDSGVSRFVLAARDTLGVGRRFVRKLANDALLIDPLAVRLPIDNIAIEILARDGAEHPTTPWRGFTRGSPGYEGQVAWSASNDVLESPSIPVAGRSNLRLFFWTRHGGSLFQQTARGRVEVSADQGPWISVSELVGYAPTWYPVSVALPAAPGASAVRVRFTAMDMTWHLDAIALGAGDAAVDRLFTSTQATRADEISVSANPVRAAPLVLRWPATTGQASVAVFSIAGTQVVSALLGADPGRWSWDLLAGTGEPVTNGAYFIVVRRGNGSALRRRILVAR